MVEERIICEVGLFAVPKGAEPEKAECFCLSWMERLPTGWGYCHKTLSKERGLQLLGGPQYGPDMLSEIAGSPRYSFTMGMPS